MQTVTLTPYTLGNSVTPAIQLYLVSSSEGVQKWQGREPAKPANGQITATLISRVSKSGVRRNKLTVNIPRLSAPTGVNPATGLAYVPTVVDSITRSYEVVFPLTSTAEECTDTFLEVGTLITAEPFLSTIRGGQTLAL